MKEKKMKRSDFLKLAATATVTGAFLKSGKTSAKEEIGAQAIEADLSKLPREIVYKNELLRMQEDLLRALKKPLKERKWSMVLDLRRCIGCSACTIG